MRLRRAGRLAQDSGQGLAEYALILALASLGMVLALMILQGRVGSTLQGTSHRIDATAAGTGVQAFPGEPLGGGTETGTGNPGAAAGETGGSGYGHGGRENGYGNRGPNGRK